MFNHIKKLGGETLLYALMNVGTKLIAFLMLPIYTRYLGTSEMGVLENVEALVSILTFVIIFGTDNSLAFYFFKTDNKEEKESFVKTVLSFRLMVSLSVLALFLTFGPVISKLLLGKSNYAFLFYFAGVGLVFDSVITLILTYFRYQFKAKKVAILTVFQMSMVATLTYFLLKYVDYNVESIYISRLISSAIIVLFLFAPLIKFFTFKVDVPKLKLILKYGAPLVPASIAFWVITFANRFFLTHMESLNSAGIYGVGIKFAAMISLLTSSVQMAWRPYSLSIQKNENAPEIYARISILLLVIGMVGLTGVATVAPFLVDLMVSQKEYAEASKYVAVLSLGSFLSFYYLIISVGLFIKEKTKLLSKYVIISALLSILLNIILIPLFSIWGAVIALILSYLFVNIIILKKSQEVYFIPFPYFNAAFIFMTGLFCMLGVTYIYESGLSKTLISVPWVILILAVSFTIMPKRFRSSNKEGE